MSDEVNIGDLNSTAPGTGARKNKGKVMYSLVPFHLLGGTARVLEAGAIKYAPWNWTKGMSWASTFECLLRHLFKWWFCREEYDEDDGEHHLDHAMCNLLFLIHHAKTFKDGDDRPPEYTRLEQHLPDAFKGRPL
jgi:hypothetical protein